MKKHLFIAAMLALASPAIFASLPQRSTSSEMKTLVPAIERAMAQQSTSPVLRKAAAEAVTVPFTHSLGRNSEVADYTVVDANGDGRTWKPGGFASHSVCMTPNADGVEACDDWLISVPVKLEAGKYYKLSFETDMTLKKTEDLLEVCMGTDATAEAMTTTLVPVFSIKYNDKVFVKKEKDFTVPADGEYFFGFHALSKKDDSGTIKLCNFSIEETAAPVVAPENAVEVPFMHTLGKTAGEVLKYTVIDANEDTKTWKPGGFSTYSVCMKPTELDNSDDWLISVPVHLKGGTDYSLSIKEGRTLSAGSEEIYGVYVGKEPTAEAMTVTAIEPHAVTVKDFNEKTGKFTVDAEGYYYIGIHCTSDRTKSGNLKVCDLSVVESSTIVEPAAAGTMSVQPAPKGELAATVTYTAPTLTTSGNPLAEISKVVLTTNWAFKQEVTDVKPGETITFTTTDIYNNGNNRFEAVAYVGETAGDPVLVKDIYAGPDNPLPPTGLKVVLSEDYKHVTLSWDAVGETGENGGYVDPSKVTYYIFDAFGSFYDPAIAETTETSYTFDYSDATAQDFVAYQVTADIDNYYTSLAATSDIVIIGEPEKTPFVDSFTDGYYQQAWAVFPDSQGQMMNGTILDNELQTNADAEEGTAPEFLNSQDADNGFFLFMPIEKDAAYGFFSTKIDISKAADPVFEFYYQGKGSVIDARIAVDGKPFETVRSIDLKENSTDGWTLCRIDLSEYKSARYIQVGVMVRAIHNTDDTTWSVPMDNIRVIDLKPTDMRVSYLTGPASVQAGESAEVSVTFENIGTQPISGASVAFSVDGVETSTATLPDFAPGKVSTASFSAPSSLLSADKLTVRFAASAAGLEQDVTAQGTINVKFPTYPSPAGLEAAADGSDVTLRWDAIDMDALTGVSVRTEDFESEEYEHFTISDFGGFHFIDGDKRMTYRFLDDVLNPYRTLPQAFQLFTPSESGMPEEQQRLDAPTHSGKSMLTAWSCDGYNDNWLIFPQLSGNAQTVSFWARSFTIGYAESFEVLVSYTDAETASFEQIAYVERVPEDWTEYSYAVPEGATYFAIRHCSYDTYALFLDDFTFETGGVLPAGTTLDGYNVYCDGVKVNEAPLTEAAYRHQADTAQPSYRVSAVYSCGESRPCDAVTVSITTGIGSVEAAQAPAEYYNLQGIRVDRPADGIFIRRQGGKASKVLVK